MKNDILNVWKLDIFGKQHYWYCICEEQNRRICKNREKEKHNDVAVNNPTGNDNTSGNKKLSLLISAKPGLSLQTAVCIISNPERNQQPV